MCPVPAFAQQRLMVAADAVFYGDNTEFRNDFREGETIFGTAARGALRVDLGDRVTLSAGIFGNQRFGSESSFELIRPVLSMSVKGRRSTFVFGTLDTPRVARPPGPDRTGPHGLLPPLQRETLAFERSHEAGLQWLFNGARLQHDLWLQWQRLNTPAHRERLDGGARMQWRFTDWLAAPIQTHIVHEGGQLYAVGPVRDSFAMASGVVLGSRREVRGVPSSVSSTDVRGSVELLGLWSHYVPDRQQPERTKDGAAFFGRAALEWPVWRVHLLVWRGDDFMKDEGDPNYQSLRRDGRRWRGVRDYAESGLTRSFPLAPGALVEASFRYHRVEDHYEYSYRLVAVISAAARLK